MIRYFKDQNFKEPNFGELNFESQILRSEFQLRSLLVIFGRHISENQIFQGFEFRKVIPQKFKFQGTKFEEANFPTAKF